ncbi:MAG: glycosyltransferase [Betaproteobacteria bacterium]|nr:glycosyltransferase [Betaproteobacteria bacterium]
MTRSASRRNPRPGLRIAVVSETYPPEINGVAATIAVMVQGLLARGHEIEVVRPRQQSDCRQALRAACAEILVAGAPVPGYATLRFGLPATALLFQRWRTVRPDIVHVVTEGPLGWSAVRAARKLALRVASDFHTNFDAYCGHYRLGWLQRPVLRYLRALHNATAVTMVPTEELRASLSQCGFERVAVVSRGVDTRLFKPACRSEALRRSWGANPDTPVVIHVSRLAPEKNLALLFRTFERMRTHCPQARLVIVGDGPERVRLERQHPEHHYAGMQRGEALAAHYASADIFLNPSLTETFGNVTIEAMASGLAVVAYDYAAARQCIRHGVNGMVAPFGDEERFTRAALELIAHGEGMESIRRAARSSAERIDWERVLDSLEWTLRSVAYRGHFRPSMSWVAPELLR